MQHRSVICFLHFFESSRRGTPNNTLSGLHTSAQPKESSFSGAVLTHSTNRRLWRTHGRWELRPRVGATSAQPPPPPSRAGISGFQVTSQCGAHVSVNKLLERLRFCFSTAACDSHFKKKLISLKSRAPPPPLKRPTGRRGAVTVIDTERPPPGLNRFVATWEN